MTMYYILLTVLAAACAVACYALAAARRRIRETADRAASAENRAQTAETRLAELTERLRTTDLDLVAARKDADALRGRLEEEEGKLREKNAMLMLQFEKTAEEIFERKSRQFRETNRESLDLVLKPLKDNISDFKRRVEEIYSQENVQRGTLKAELNNLMELNRRITEETNNLTTALRGNSKLQGDWGETILETLLESSDLQRGLHYTTQTNVKDAEGNNLRPDVILKLPDGKRVVIDSKVSLTAYVNYTSAIDEESRRRALHHHLRSVRNHVNELGRKSYQDNVLGSPDFVVMFIPTEPAFLDAVHADPELWNDAYRRKVILSSPTNLFAILKVVDDLWKRDDLGRNASRIAKEGAMMYDKFAGFVSTLETIGKGIDTLHGNYEKAMKQLSTGTGNLVSRAQRLAALNVKISRSLPKTLTEEADDTPAEE